MHIKPGVIIKDIIILLALIFLLSLLFKRVNKYIAIHKESIIHELDTSFFDLIKTMQRHAGIAYQAIHHDLVAENPSLKRTIKTIQESLESIEQKYIHNPAGLALLGPIGSAAIVLKEQQLQDQLIGTAATIHEIFCSILNKPILTDDQKKSLTIQD